MKIQRLAWAGIKIEADNQVILVDAMADPDMKTGFTGDPLPDGAIISAGEDQSVDYTIITHRHVDHFDEATIRRFLKPDGKVICSEWDIKRITEKGHNAVAVGLYQTIEVGNIKITAVPAVDGIGHDQVSWVIDADGKRIIHCGDTLWHSYWYGIVNKCGPFDVAFLPINGARTYFDFQQPHSDMPAVLTPEQAAIAGMILGAKSVVPIHYKLFDYPDGVYREYPNAEQTFIDAAAARNVPVLLVEPGEWIDFS